jgi:hypothetical protein
VATRIDEEFTAEDLLEELQQFHSPISERREGGITAGEYAKAQIGVFFQCKCNSSRRKGTITVALRLLLMVI